MLNKMNVKMNNLQLAVNNPAEGSKVKADEILGEIPECNVTQEVTMGGPSINLLPKFIFQDGQPDIQLINDQEENMMSQIQQSLVIDKYSVNYRNPIRVEEQEEDTINEAAQRDPYSSSSSDQDGQNDEYDIDLEEGDQLSGDYRQLLIDGAGQETMEVILDIEKLAEQGKQEFIQELIAERDIQMLSQESAYKYTNMKSRLLEEQDVAQKTPKTRGVVYIPPPNPLLPKQMMADEPLRNGFLRKFIDIGKRPRVFEKERAPCGLIRQMNVKSYNTQKSIPTQVHPASALTEAKQQIDAKPIVNGNSDNPSIASSLQEEFSNPGNETSLRHFFYMEYRKLNEGEINPIVYSRFGKQHYDSDEKFNPENFSQLIRTCNIKRLLQGLPGDMNLPINQLQSQMANHMREYYRMKEECRDAPIFPQEPAPSRSYYIPKNINDNTLVFESRFECGNLQLAHKQAEKEYNLILQNDINSKGHTQWFYFRVQNTKKGQKVKFNMLNLLKSKSLFNEGMKVLAFSERKLEEQQIGWHRSGEDIAYFQNNYRREQMTNYQRCYHTFTFTYNFEYENDTVFFAYSQPYSYSDLIDDIKEIEMKKLDYVSRNTLCRTLAGNRCEYLTITSRSNNTDPSTQKKGVVITARVHPGESNSSWMMKGLIDFLIGESKEAKDLRDNFVFKIIPMLNPDGVINGNYRCSLAGCDLNRRWKYPSPILHPTIHSTKQLIKQFSTERPLVLFCDLHGHSRRKNIFMYGNSDAKCPEAYRIFPYLMSKISGPLFSYDYSRFKVQKNKEQTARIALWKDLKNPNIFTMEASFCGPKQSSEPSDTTPNDLNYHYNAEDLMEAGKKLCETILLYNNTNIDIIQQIEEIKTYHTKKQDGPQSAVFSGQKNLAQMIPGESKQDLKQRNGLKKQEKLEYPSLPLTTATLDQSKSDNQGTIMVQFNLKEIVTELKQKIQIEKLKKKEAASLKETAQNLLQDLSSDEDSDSGESEDNLDADQLQQIMPKKIIKKANAANAAKKKKPLKSSAPITFKKVMKEDEKKKEEEKNGSQRRQSIRALRDFKKPTQSFLQRYGLVGPNNKNKFGQGKRDICVQTFENEDAALIEVGDPNQVELSAMERDIMLCTGCIPDKIRKLAQTIRFEDLSVTNFLHLIRIESAKLQGVNYPLFIRRDRDSLVIGRGSLYSLASLTSPLLNKVNPNTFGSSTKSFVDDQESHRIKIDLARAHDKFKDSMRKTTINTNPAANPLSNNMQVLFSKHQSSLEKENKASFRAPVVGQFGPLTNFELISKEHSSEIVGFASTASSEVLNQITNNLNIVKQNEISMIKEKGQNNSSYDVSEKIYLIGKNPKTIENFRQDSTQSQKLLAQIEQRSAQNSKFSGNNPSSSTEPSTNTRRGGFLQQENVEYFGMHHRQVNNPAPITIQEPQIISKSTVNGPMVASSTITDLNQSAYSNLPNSRSSSYQRKFVDNSITNNGSIKAPRSSVGGTQKTMTLTHIGLNQTQITSYQPNSAAGPARNQSNDSSLKNIWDSINRVAPSKNITTQQNQPHASIHTPMILNSSNSTQNRGLQEYMKHTQISTSLEKIEEKNHPRSSSQGNYNTSTKYQSMKSKITSIQQQQGRLVEQNAVKGAQNKGIYKEEVLISNRTLQNQSQAQQQMNGNYTSLSNAGGLNSANMKKNIEKKTQLLKERVANSANQNQFVMGLLSRI